MKLAKFANPLMLGLILTVAAAGCAKKPDNLNTIYGARTPNPKDETLAPPIKPSEGVEATEGHPIIDPNLRKDWPRDSKIFESETVHFAFDSSVVRTPEKPKVATVADYLKANAQNALEIDGHCDERGTEEYNRSLGERRALALREELIRLGIDPRRVDTVTYGKDRPVDPGHDESAWKKNRRGEFLLETPPK